MIITGHIKAPIWRIACVWGPYLHGCSGAELGQESTAVMVY